MNSEHSTILAALARLKREMQSPQGDTPSSAPRHSDQDERHIQRLAQGIANSLDRARADFDRLCDLLAACDERVERYLPPSTLAAMAVHADSLAHPPAQIQLRKLVEGLWEISSDGGVTWKCMDAEPLRCQRQPAAKENSRIPHECRPRYPEVTRALQKPEQEEGAPRKDQKRDTHDQDPDDSFALFVKNMPRRSRRNRSHQNERGQSGNSRKMQRLGHDRNDLENVLTPARSDEVLDDSFSLFVKNLPRSSARMD